MIMQTIFQIAQSFAWIALVAAILVPWIVGVNTIIDVIFRGLKNP